VLVPLSIVTTLFGMFTKLVEVVLCTSKSTSRWLAGSAAGSPAPSPVAPVPGSGGLSGQDRHGHEPQQEPRRECMQL
jgi:hypothetical protein